MPRTKTEAKPRVPSRLVSVPIDQLGDSPDNIRSNLGDLSELTATIRTAGILEPLIVAPVREPNGQAPYVVVAGHRRLAAAKEAGMARVPVIVADLSEQERLEVMLIENLQRQDLDPLEEARGYRALLDLKAYSQHQLAERIGRNQSHVSKRLALLGLPAVATAALDAGGITVEDALELAKLKNIEGAVEAVLAPPKRDDFYGRHRTLKEKVHEELERDRQLKAVRSKIEELQDKDVRTILHDGPRFRQYPYQPVGRQRYYSSELEHVDARKHAKEPCHAVAVFWGYGDKAEAIPVCTEPKNHPAPKSGKRPGGGLTEEEKRRRKAKREHRAAMAAANADRLEFERALLKKKPRAADVVAHMAYAALAEGNPQGLASDFGHVRVAAELLGVKVGQDTYGYGIRKRIREFADQSDDNVLRAGLALAFAQVERSWQADMPSHGDRARQHFEYLATHGYTRSKAEGIELAGKAPR